MSDVLSRIAAYKRADVAQRKQAVPEGELERRAATASPPRGFRAKLQAAVNDGRFGLIAEIKRASPSKGLIRADFDPPALARAYEAGGATCLSVLTDTPSFQGADEHLIGARAAVGLPVLRKDFLFEPYQVVEARALGADCVLIIMAAVTDDEARALAETARALGMDALVEIHDEPELDRALEIDAAFIGVNNRNLKTFETTLATSERLATRIPRDRLVVAESGIANHAHVARLAKAGISCFLVGESLMREADVTAATRALLGAQ